MNADDFGYTQGVNRAIVESARDGILTSATLMATGAAFEDAVVNAGNLAVGAHIQLLDGVPATEARHIARNGHFVTRSPLKLARLVRSEQVRTEIEREAVAQISLIQQAGITVTHVDTHKHTHMFPQVLRAVLRAARECGVKRVRNPFEPAWAIGFRQSLEQRHRVRSAQVAVLRAMLLGVFLREVRSAGMVTTDGAIGVTTTGTLDTELLLHMLSRLPEGTWELVCHPGYADDALRVAQTRLINSRDVERKALVAPEVLNSVQRNCIELVTFAQL